MMSNKTIPYLVVFMIVIILLIVEHIKSSKE